MLILNTIHSCRLPRFRKAIQVLNLPIVQREKFEQFQRSLHSIFSIIGVIKDDGLNIPVHLETGEILGFCIIEYEDMYITPQVNNLLFIGLYTSLKLYQSN